MVTAADSGLCYCPDVFWPAADEKRLSSGLQNTHASGDASAAGCECSISDKRNPKVEANVTVSKCSVHNESKKKTVPLSTRHIWAVWHEFRCKFLGEYSSERILKNGQLLSKLRTDV